MCKVGLSKLFFIPFTSEYPGLSFIRMEEFRERFLNGTLETFDAVFTFSSVEHSGLGEIYFKNIAFLFSTQVGMVTH